MDGAPIGNASTDELEGRLLQWLAKRMPEARALHLSNLRKPGTGMSSDTSLFTIHWSESGSGKAGAGSEKSLDAVLRCAPRSRRTLSRVRPRDAVRDHAAAAARTRTCPYPRCSGRKRIRAWLGVPFLTMKAVAGEPPLDWPSYHASGFYAELSEPNRRKLWHSTIDALARLHRADWRAIGLDFVPGGRPGDDPERYVLQYWRRYLDEWIKDDPSEVVPVYDEALDWLEKHRPECPRTALVWGDAKLGNVLYRVDSCEVAAVIDWEIAMIGDPQVDLASLRISDLRAQQSAGRCLPGNADRSRADRALRAALRQQGARLPVRPAVFRVLAGGGDDQGHAADEVRGARHLRRDAREPLPGAPHARAAGALRSRNGARPVGSGDAVPDETRPTMPLAACRSSRNAFAAFEEDSKWVSLIRSPAIPT